MARTCQNYEKDYADIEADAEMAPSIIPNARC